MITEIDIDKICPNQKNPRKELGDLEELTKSIEAFGVLQNLTVVPNDDDWETFTVVCGHRRLAAAKEAGLRKVPCSISEMDEKTQLSMMLLENMQRSDLTLLEEAKGFQMMLDLGISMREIVERTGLSYTKVRHRVKLNELDQELLAEKAKGSISINDLIKLEKLEDPEHKKKALEKIGTNNFNWEVESLFKEECKNHVVKKLEALLPEAQITQNWTQYKEVCSLKYTDASDKKISEFAAELKRCAEEENAGMLVHLGWDTAAGKVMVEPKRSEPQSASADPERAKREQERQDRIAGLESMGERICDNIKEFVQNLSDKRLEEAVRIAMPYAALAMAGDFGTEPDTNNVLEFLDIEADIKVTGARSDRRKAEIAAVRAALEEDTNRTFLSITIMSVLSSLDDLWSWEGKFNEGGIFLKDIESMYDMIIRAGYVAADEELDFINGDSDLYLKEEEE